MVGRLPDNVLFAIDRLIGDVMEQRSALIAEALRLSPTTTHALALPTGASTFRAHWVNATNQIVGEFVCKNPAAAYPTFEDAVAAALLHFGQRPLVGAASLAGPVPDTGELSFPNIPAWKKFGRRPCGVRFVWLNDGRAGYEGLSELAPAEFTVIRDGDGDGERERRYAIVGTGLNLGGPANAREDGRGPFAAWTKLEREFSDYLTNTFGYLPGWEAACSGSMGFRNAAAFIIKQRSAATNDPFVQAFRTAPEEIQGEVVTEWALRGHAIAVAAARLVFDLLGRWAGMMAVTAQADEICFSEGILGNAALREFCVRQTSFLQMFNRQTSKFASDWATRCRITVCNRNPELAWPVARAAAMLRELNAA